MTQLQRLGEMALRGTVMQFAPTVLRGFIIELLHRESIDVVKATRMVQQKQDLWDLLGEHDRDRVRRAARKMGSLDWFTAEWLIDAVRKDQPALASLFLGWRKAHNWLEKQIEIFKEQAKS